MQTHGVFTLNPSPSVHCVNVHSHVYICPSSLPLDLDSLGYFDAKDDLKWLKNKNTDGQVGDNTIAIQTRKFLFLPDTTGDGVLAQTKQV